MSAPAGLVLLPPYPESQAEDQESVDCEEEEGINYREEQEYLGILIQKEARLDAQGNAFSEPRILIWKFIHSSHPQRLLYSHVNFHPPL